METPPWNRKDHGTRQEVTSYPPWYWHLVAATKVGGTHPTGMHPYLQMTLFVLSFVELNLLEHELSSISSLLKLKLYKHTQILINTNVWCHICRNRLVETMVLVHKLLRALGLFRHNMPSEALFRSEELQVLHFTTHFHLRWLIQSRMFRSLVEVVQQSIVTEHYLFVPFHQPQVHQNISFWWLARSLFLVSWVPSDPTTQRLKHN